MHHTREDLVAGVRAMADYLEANRDVPVPLCVTAYNFYYEREEFLKAANALAGGGGMIKKEKGDSLTSDYKVIRHFGPVEIAYSIPRKLICRLVQAAVYDCPDSLLEEAAEFLVQSEGTSE